MQQADRLVGTHADNPFARECVRFALKDIGAVLRERNRVFERFRRAQLAAKIGARRPNRTCNTEQATSNAEATACP